MEEKKQELGIIKDPQTQVVDQQPKQEKRKLGWALCAAGLVPLVAAVLVVVLALACIYPSFVSASGGVPSIFGISVFSIQTDSMYPNLLAGDLIICRSVDPKDLRVDDVITYWTIIDGDMVLNTHRIQGIYDDNGFLFFETKGDANTANDALAVYENAIVAKYTGIRLKNMGMVFDYLQTSTGLLLFVLITAFLIFLLLVLGIVLMAIGLVFVIRNRRKNK